MIAYIIVHIISIMIGLCFSQLMISAYKELKYEENKKMAKNQIRILQACSLFGPLGLLVFCFGFIIYIIKMEFKYIVEDLKEIWK